MGKVQGRYFQVMTSLEIARKLVIGKFPARTAGQLLSCVLWTVHSPSGSLLLVIEEERVGQTRN